MWAIFKVFIEFEFVTVLLLFYVLLFLEVPEQN